MCSLFPPESPAQTPLGNNTQGEIIEPEEELQSKLQERQKEEDSNQNNNENKNNNKNSKAKHQGNSTRSKTLLLQELQDELYFSVPNPSEYVKKIMLDGMYGFVFFLYIFYLILILISFDFDFDFI